MPANQMDLLITSIIHEAAILILAIWVYRLNKEIDEL